MLWKVIVKPEGSTLNSFEVAAALRLDPPGDSQPLNRMIDAAARYAENAMGCSLLTRTIQATYYDPAEPVYLPRGPVQAILSVTHTPANTPIAPAQYQLQAAGNVESLAMVGSWTWQQPLVVTYTAGYGSQADIPADITWAMIAHVAHLYNQRESVSLENFRDVPQSLADFYRLNSRHGYAT